MTSYDDKEEEAECLTLLTCANEQSKSTQYTLSDRVRYKGVVQTAETGGRFTGLKRIAAKPTHGGTSITLVRRYGR